MSRFERVIYSPLLWFVLLLVALPGCLRLATGFWQVANVIGLAAAGFNLGHAIGRDVRGDA